MYSSVSFIQPMFHLKPNPPAGVRRPGHPAPRGGLLGDHHDPRDPLVAGGVDLLEERQGVQVLPAAKLVRQPLAFLARVVEVNHRRDGVHPQPVDVELLEPVDGVGDEEVAHLAAAVVEHQRPPVGVRPEPRVGVLVQGSAVELCQCPGVAREVRRHPVDDHPDTRLVQRVHQEAEVVRVPVPRRWRVVGRDLVAPGAAEGMLGHREELHVGEPHAGHVLRELHRELPVGQPRPPGTEVHLVDAQRGSSPAAGAPGR